MPEGRKKRRYNIGVEKGREFVSCREHKGGEDLDVHPLNSQGATKEEAGKIEAKGGKRRAYHVLVPLVNRWV